MRKSLLGALGLATVVSLVPAGAVADTSGPDRAGPPQPRAAEAARAAETPRTAEAARAAGEEDLGRQLATVRRVTAAYHDSAQAEADGFERTSPCVPEKGVHFLRSVAEGQDDLAVDQPNALVYHPRADGSLELRGVEYVSETPATLFGRDFELSSGINLYTLHLWVWEHRPDDLFAPDNPRLTCES